MEAYFYQIEKTTRSTVADIHIKNSNPAIRLAKVTELESAAEMVKELTKLVRAMKNLKETLPKKSASRDITKSLLTKHR